VGPVKPPVSFLLGDNADHASNVPAKPLPRYGAAQLIAPWQVASLMQVSIETLRLPLCAKLRRQPISSLLFSKIVDGLFCHRGHPRFGLFSRRRFMRA
jgi:hypothetical protein